MSETIWVLPELKATRIVGVMDGNKGLLATIKEKVYESQDEHYITAIEHMMNMSSKFKSGINPFHESETRMFKSSITTLLRCDSLCRKHMTQLNSMAKQIQNILHLNLEQTV